MFLSLATKFGIIQSFFYFFPIAYSEPKAKTVHNSEISSFDFSKGCRIAPKLIDLTVMSFKSRMYSGLLRTTVVGACCPRIIIPSALFQYYTVLTWLTNHIVTLFKVHLRHPLFEAFSDPPNLEPSSYKWEPLGAPRQSRFRPCA